jgi:putative oxidoreductase
MNAVYGLGKYLFAIPFAIFGIFHFMNADGMAGMAYDQPILVYISGAALIAAALSMLIGKMDKLASTMLGILLLLFVFLIHLKGAIGGDQAAMGGLLKDLMLAGASFMYAKNEAKDNAVIG